MQLIYFFAMFNPQSLKEKIISGAILCLSGIPKGIKRDEIKAAFGEHGKVEWVDIVEDQSVVRSAHVYVEIP